MEESINGVTIPGVSAGSNHVGAMVTSTAHVICPAGAAWAAPGAHRARTMHKATVIRIHDLLGAGESAIITNLRNLS
jgi:hypothetical protein